MEGGGERSVEGEGGGVWRVGGKGVWRVRGEKV